ncbi:MAG: hypothetical protein ACYC7E_03805 [Armatimonadota bacterium]
MLIIVLPVMVVRYAWPRGENFGLYYGTLARSLAPVYVLSIILFTFTAQPWLLYQEASWLRKDTALFGNLAKRDEETAGFTPMETRAAQKLTELIIKAVDQK